MWSLTDQGSKHGVETDDVLHAVAHVLVVADLGDDADDDMVTA